MKCDENFTGCDSDINPTSSEPCDTGNMSIITAHTYNENVGVTEHIRLEGPEDRHLRNSSFGGHVTSLTLQYLWPRPPGVWLGGPGCKPGHSRQS